MHLSFNIIGTLLFLFGVYAFQYTIGLSFWNNPITSNDIANFHSIFNITVTILLIPFAELLEKLALTFIHGDKETDADDQDMSSATLDERFLRSPGLAIDMHPAVLSRWASLLPAILWRVTSLFADYDTKLVEKSAKRKTPLTVWKTVSAPI